MRSVVLALPISVHLVFLDDDDEGDGRQDGAPKGDEATTYAPIFNIENIGKDGNQTVTNEYEWEQLNIWFISLECTYPNECVSQGLELGKNWLDAMVRSKCVGKFPKSFHVIIYKKN